MSTKKVDLETLNTHVRRERQQKQRKETPVHVIKLAHYLPYITACGKEVVDGLHVTGNPPDRKLLEEEELTLCPACDKNLR